MNHKQWEALKAATRGHTPGPWLVSDGESADIIADDGALWFEGWVNDADIALTAAAPYLLAEVERLRGWLDFISENPRGGHVTYVHAQNALNGAEVPK